MFCKIFLYPNKWTYIMKIFLIRHGQTDYGKKQLTTGQVNVPLNDNGKEEARATAQFLKDKNITQIFSSSLSRASETAHIIASELNLSVVEYDELMEHTSGKLDGVPMTEFFETLKRVGDFEEMIVQAGGEPRDVFLKRIWTKFLEISTENEDKGNLVIVSHGVVLRTLISEIFNAPYLRNLSQGNCCVNILNYDKEKEGFFRVELLNHTFHIPKSLKD
jgi:probable phosphoglycerate mutase